MLAYWLIFLFPAFMALNTLRPSAENERTVKWSVYWWIMYLILVLAIGLRHEVGGDWYNYLDKIYYATFVPLSEAIRRGDPAYAVLNWLGGHWGGIYLVNTISASLFTLGLVAFARVQPRPWLAMVVAIPYLVTVVAMGYTRQGVAIGLAMMGLAALTRGRVIKYILWITLAATFHKSAVILLPLVVFSRTKRFFYTLIWATLTTVLLYILLIQESLDNLVTNYIDAQYASSGAVIRVVMNLLPSLTFLVFRKHFKLSREQLSFWTWVALGGILFVVLLYISPSTTAVDRVALYWIPIQIFVWSRIPDVLGRSGQTNELLVISVILYSAAILFVWLLYAGHAFAWLPYQIVPWGVLW